LAKFSYYPDQLTVAQFYLKFDVNFAHTRVISLVIKSANIQQS